MARPPDTPLVRRLRALAEPAPITVAHRGDSGNFPENTLAAFGAAVRLGVGMVEFDVQVAGDGTLVCIHDDTLDRTTDAAAVLGQGVRIADVGIDVLGRLDAGAWKGAAHRGARIPTFADGLHVISEGAVPMIEHKTGTPESYLAVIGQLGLVDHVIAQSFDWDVVREFRRREPRITIGLLGPSDTAPALTDQVLRRIDEIGADLVHWDEGELRAEDLAALHQRGLLVCTYTTDDDMGLAGGAFLGIDAITTNLPGRLLTLVRNGLARRPQR